MPRGHPERGFRKHHGVFKPLSEPQMVLGGLKREVASRREGQEGGPIPPMMTTQLPVDTAGLGLGCTI